MAYKKALPESPREVKVSDVFITEYMPDSNGNFVKVYLLGLSQCTNEKPMSHSEMAETLGLLESDVIRAWKYWADKKVVKFDGENVEFVDLDHKEPIKIIETKPVYYPEEIAACTKAHPELEGMFQIVQKILQKPFSSADLTVIYSLYDYYRLPLDVIPMLVTYCVKNGKKSMRQIEKTAAIWVDKEIDSVEAAESYLKKAEEYAEAISRLKNAMGVTDRKFSPTETKYINEWLFDLKVPFETIMKAYDICASNIGKLSVKYMNSVILNLRNGTGFSEKAAKESDKKSRAVPTKFSNFDQRDFDYDAFEKKSAEGAVNK
ncbi:MAG: DnaD domain protein [Monoglobales bacterium]